MSLPNTFTGIANSALSRVREARITSIADEGDENAERIRDLLPDICREVLEMGHWNTATKRVIISRNAGNPVGEFNLSYPKPTDLIKITLAMNAEGQPEAGGGPITGRVFTDYDVDGSRILRGVDYESGTSDIALAYVAYDETKAGEWSPGLRDMIALRLASRIAIMTAGSTKLADYYRQQFEREINRAIRNDKSNEGAFMQRYSNDDEGMQQFGYSQLHGGLKQASFTGVGYSKVA